MGNCFGKTKKTKSEDPRIHPKITRLETKLTECSTLVCITTVEPLACERCGALQHCKVEVQQVLQRLGFSNFDPDKECRWVLRDIPLRSYGIDESSPTGVEDIKPVNLVWSLVNEM